VRQLAHLLLEWADPDSNCPSYVWMSLDGVSGQPVIQDTSKNHGLINFSSSERSSPIGDTALPRLCRQCHRHLELKDRRIRTVDTVFGTIRLQSSGIVTCPCESICLSEVPYDPMSEFVPERATGKLVALEAKLSAQMPYRQAAAMICEFLPVRSTLNHVTVRNRGLRASARVDAVARAMTLDPDHSRRIRSGTT
jgi:hypothetical protein